MIGELETRRKPRCEVQGDARSPLVTSAVSIACTGSLPSTGATHLERANEILAEREGFEPPIRLPVCRISSAVLSTAQPPLRRAERGVLARDAGSNNEGLGAKQGRGGRAMRAADRRSGHLARRLDA